MKRYITIVDMEMNLICSYRATIDFEDKEMILRNGYLVIVSNNEPVFRVDDDNVKFVPSDKVT